MSSYQRIIDLLDADPEKTIFKDYYQSPAYTLGELADLAHCSGSAVNVAIHRMKKAGFSVRKNSDKEFYIDHGKNFTPAEVRMEKDKHLGHTIFIGRYGNQYSTLQMHNMREIRQVYNALGKYMQDLVEAQS